MSIIISGPTSDSGGDNPIDAARRVDWTLAGVEGDIPTGRTQSGSTITAYTGTAGTINTALTNAASGTYVLLGAGTFILSSSIVMKSNVTLRGSGVGSTQIQFSNRGGTTFQYNGDDPPIYFGASSITPDFGNPSPSGFPSAQKKGWTGCNGSSGSYPRGATVLNLASAPSGLSAGMTAVIYQTDEDPGTGVSSGTPLSGGGNASLPRDGWWICNKTDHSGTTAWGTNWQGNNLLDPNNVQQRVKVTNVSGSQVTISPGLLHPEGTWKSGLSPSLGWQTNEIVYAGIEDCRINCNAGSGTNGLWSVVQFFFAANCWITRCLVQGRTQQSGGNNVFGVIHMMESRNITVRSNWIDVCRGGAQGTTTTYGTPSLACTLNLIENNIYYHVESPLLTHGNSLCCVYAYNLEIHNTSVTPASGTQSGDEGGSQTHAAGSAYALLEGNQTIKFWGDLFHGISGFVTNYRVYQTDSGECAFDLEANTRYLNVLGCIITSSAGYTTLSSDSTKHDRFTGYAFRLGYNGEQATTDPFIDGDPNIGVTHDPQVAATLFRWGNRTLSSSTTRFLSSECPSGEAFFPNAVPASQTLPASMYKAAIPSWFTYDGTTVAWPPIGPDVTGGANGSGYAHKLPAQLAYDATGGTSTSFDPSLYG